MMQIASFETRRSSRHLNNEILKKQSAGTAEFGLKNMSGARSASKESAALPLLGRRVAVPWDMYHYVG
jgi:hypothetical protein